MFIDTAKIFVKAGDGGDGIVAFRREKFIPQGGPSGGDGGNGADVIFRVDEGLKTLMDFHYQRHFKAEQGERGKVKNMHGANAKPMIVRVPPGTLIIDEASNDVIADLVAHGQEVVVAKGGRGGRGNVRFATPRNPAPYVAENGEPGEERMIILELKLLADVGLVGFPNVGKSTLISVVSAAKPKIASYHFTTLVPNLGVVDVGDGRSFVMADLPGLIEGAHEGVGLGHEFLKHIERTKIIVHVIDMSASEGRDPFTDWLQINNELVKYNAKLEELPQVIVANKMDMPGAEDHLAMFLLELEQYCQDNGLEEESFELFPISALMNKGTQQLLYKVADLIDELPELSDVVEVPDIAERKVYRLEEEEKADDFNITREGDVFVVAGPSIDRLLHMTQFGSHEAVTRFTRTLRRMGVDEELRKLGAEHGQTIRIGELEFEYFE